VIIAHLGPSVLPVRFQFGGAIQRRILELARNQAALGHTVTVYSAAGHAGVEFWHGVQIKNIECRRRLLFFRDLEYLENAARILERETTDVLHFHSLPEASLILGKIRAKKVLSYDHFVFRRGKKNPLFWLYRKALQEFDHLLPVSKYCRRESLAYWNLQSVPTSVVHNGVNLEQFFPDAASESKGRQAHGLDGARVILYVGRVCRQKGTDVLIESYRLLKRRISNLALVVAGPAERFENGAPSELTQEVAAAGGLYLGAVPEEDLARIYNMADVFVMPTRELEMFGMAAVEGQACGKPVVASHHGGLLEVVSEASGLFFPVGDSAALAEKLELLLTNGVILRSKSQAARENVQRFEWSRIARQLEEIYAAPRSTD